jgi:hypothetical protein
MFFVIRSSRCLSFLYWTALLARMILATDADYEISVFRLVSSLSSPALDLLSVTSGTDGIGDSLVLAIKFRVL